MLKSSMLLPMILLMTARIFGQDAGPNLTEVLEKVQNKEAVLIDVREQDEWDEEHLEGAVPIPYSSLKGRRTRDTAVAKLDKNIPIYCHCKAGVRAKWAGKIFSDLGFECIPLTQSYETIVASGFPESP